jgi:hypothetical protein
MRKPQAVLQLKQVWGIAIAIWPAQPSPQSFERRRWPRLRMAIWGGQL